MLDFTSAADAWMADGLCLEFPEVDFFPSKGASCQPAKRICRRCLVGRECLAFALREGIDEGVWGATAPRERRALRRVPLAQALDAAESRLQRERRLDAEQLEYEREHGADDNDF